MEYKSPTEIIARVGKFMAEPLAAPVDQPRLYRQLSGIEACRFDLAEKTTEWHRILAEQKRRMVHPKDKDLTELDRTVMLDARVAVIRQDYEFLCKLDELVRDRIELGKLLLTLNK